MPKAIQMTGCADTKRKQGYSKRISPQDMPEIRRILNEQAIPHNQR